MLKSPNGTKGQLIGTVPVVSFTSGSRVTTREEEPSRAGPKFLPLMFRMMLLSRASYVVSL